ncbi:metallophosphoesterase [Halobacillus sp. Marseille-Q1614]|uniref:metallophosphoesterase n=1 Tax=Halobacillus sp. Marseille-Q1614 TaxID=2709134 RepID=UPI001570C069|nr:metallophosphoesterase [Halobacillus sp. Marseille-Q1614]
MKKRLVFFTFIPIIFASIKAIFDTNVFKVNSVHFLSNKLPKGSKITILQISDLHNKEFGENNQKLLYTAEKLNPDIIVMTGDLISRGTKQFERVFSFVEKLTSVHESVYFVSGNHEWDNPRIQEFFDGLKVRKVTILDNQHTIVTKNEVKLHLIGVGDCSTDHENTDKAFDGIDQERYTILLSHSPSITKKYSGLPADLVLSGHTHGGQVRIPLIGAVVAPEQKLFPNLDKGTFKTGQDQMLYIDSGLGTSKAPIRFLNQSQISFIQITSDS